MTEATISVIPKKGKDPLKCESYRPISLLGVDYKILTKLLAARLDTVMQKIVHPDQSGFISGRQLYGNLRRLYNIIYSPKVSNVAEVLITLDTIEYEYLFKVLEKFGFGASFCSWIRVLYTFPQAAVRTNSMLSQYFRVKRGTRQGCPLSPLSFDLAIEPLAAAIRCAKQVHDITRGEQTHKLALYMDNLLLYLSDPDVSIPKVMSIISEFGEISGYKINPAKSLLFPINELAKLM